MLRLVPPAVMAAMGIAFVVFATRVRDPAVLHETFPVGDLRAHRYGAMTYSQVTSLIAQLRADRSSVSDPDEKAALSTRLSDIFAARRLFEDARQEIDEARRVAPGEPAVLLRAALIDHQLGRDTEAEALLRQAETGLPGDAEIARVRRFIETTAVSREDPAMQDRSQ